jgi:hypothetical protein
LKLFLYHFYQFIFIFFFFCVEAADRLLAIQIITDKAFKTLTIQDNGIGMSKVGMVGSFCSIPSSSPGELCQVHAMRQGGLSNRVGIRYPSWAAYDQQAVRRASWQAWAATPHKHDD